LKKKKLSFEDDYLEELIVPEEGE